MAVTPNIVASGRLQIAFNNPGSPQILDINLNGKSLVEQIILGINSTLIGTRQYRPFADSILLDSYYERLLYDYFDEVIVLSQTNQVLAFACTDFFFSFSCNLYWELISKRGSKNLARAFLEEICNLVNKWEKKTKNRIHKGTPYYFLTFVYREMGDIDSAFASSFKAISEDKKSFGKPNYRNAPAHKYVTIVDDKSNYLYETIVELRTFLNGYVEQYQNAFSPTFTMNVVDTKFLQGNSSLEDLAFIFVYNLELLKKHFEQMPTLPNSDFYKLKNIQIIFNLALIADKLLQKKYGIRFKRNVRPKRSMYISDGVVLLFADKGWIGQLTPNQRADPKSIIGNTNPLVSDDPRTYVTNLVVRPQPITFGVAHASPQFNNQMRSLYLCYKLRNKGAHSMEMQNIFTDQYKIIIKHLMFSIFTAIEML